MWIYTENNGNDLKKKQVYIVYVKHDLLCLNGLCTLYVSTYILL